MRFGKVLATIVLLAGLALTGLVACGPAEPPGVAADRAALEAFYHATGGTQWSYNENWLSDEPLGEWYGVYTDSNGRVRVIDLETDLTDLLETGLLGNNIAGPIPPELGNLSNLAGLYLSRNRLSGPIPPELGNLSNLTELSLGRNQLSGPIPPELGNLSNLTELSLGRNQLSGPIPPELGKMSNLKSLGLSDNRLTGTVPPELGNLSNLTELLLYDNGLKGQLPLSLTQTALDRLGYEGNDGLCMLRRVDSVQSWRKGLSFVEGPNCWHR